MKKPLLMDLEDNVFLEDDALVVIDRRRLPREIVRLRCPDHEAVARAIEEMAVQGAGDIAITAGFGLYLAARQAEQGAAAKRDDALRAAAARLIATRPTGYHLAALVNKLMRRVGEAGDAVPASGVILSSLRRSLEAQRRISEDTGRHAETLLASGDRVLTHCFAGPALLYMLAFAREKGKELRVVCTETRPYLQGARLTAWSVSELGIDTTLITDNMAAHCMAKGMVNKLFAAADRVAMDGVVANKVGTLQLAICADYFKIPFYVLAYGGPDPGTLRGADIPIEERDPREVLEFLGAPISGPCVKGYYPAFDLTPAGLVTGIVTAAGVNPRQA
ncbi:MAG: s-methyl-5-thioribose-1-phosphate isomerase [Pseudomonadota bacterium]|jgi:methylthioribose-1-phosphate isomerase|nr:s-methyl-5-thioribose-1-phosphate isomerase [Syntrophaceae bacterium]MBP7033607.1 s-methyl-5-thioribose-1-phosphate isomerase [Syntrophobacterales bacterium]MDI9554625.1 s-methyl-5-thioribose-1-phosphate isomerase [Pseudomonadota bacterium]NLX31334.1 s-methyl-5-thioribose-1-phosphate isomerase [Deltaproteobacteria bacterium]HNU85417.1 s-methyl-5-thioribose-1-phosphate isomerase [Syntrophales bacterium]